MKRYIRTLGTGLMMIGVLSSGSVCMAQGVIVNDGKNISTQAEEFFSAVEGLVDTTEKLALDIRGLTDLGSLMDELFDLGFLFPQPALSSEVVEAVPKDEQKSSGVGGSAASTATSALSGITGGSSSSEDEKFGSSKQVQASVAKNMQVTSDSSDSGGDDGGLLSTVQSAVSTATGQGGQGLMATDVSKKRAQLTKSKQAFARYSLAAALVHRTLAHRTLETTEKNTKQKAAETVNTRKTQTAKVYGNAQMAETYNRLLLSQAAANGLSAFASLDEFETKVDFNVLGVTDGVAGSTTGADAVVGKLSTQLGI